MSNTEDEEDYELRQQEDEYLEDIRNGTLIKSIDRSDLPMFDSEGQK
jgi:hypothetical protein